MAPDYIAELALIEMSRMQREHWYDYAALEAYAAEQEKENHHARAVSGPQDRAGSGDAGGEHLGGRRPGGVVGRLDREEPGRGEQEAA